MSLYKIYGMTNQKTDLSHFIRYNCSLMQAFNQPLIGMIIWQQHKAAQVKRFSQCSYQISEWEKSDLGDFDCRMVFGARKC